MTAFADRLRADRVAPSRRRIARVRRRARCCASPVPPATRSMRRAAPTLTAPQRCSRAPRSRVDALPAARPAPYLLFRSHCARPHRTAASRYEQLDANGRRAALRHAAALRARARAPPGRGICLEAKRGALTTLSRTPVRPRNCGTLHSSRWPARRAAPGCRPTAGWRATTVFVSGHSYSAPGFTTRTSIVDVASGQLRGRRPRDVHGPARRPAVQGGRLQLLGRHLHARRRSASTPRCRPAASYSWSRATSRRDACALIHDDVECPSLSPDGTRIAFKRRVASAAKGRFVWRLPCSNWRRGRETALATETRSVDDQVEWLDDARDRLCAAGRQPRRRRGDEQLGAGDRRREPAATACTTRILADACALAAAVAVYGRSSAKLAAQVPLLPPRLRGGDGNRRGSPERTTIRRANSCRECASWV